MKIGNTYMAKKETVKRKWYLVDATDRILGRMATRLATILMGKHKPIYTPHVDTGDFVIVTNAEKIKLTGKKWDNKTYQHYSGYADGRKVVPIKRVMERHPERVVYSAVVRMIPRTKLGRHMITKLKVYKGASHPHQAQKPEKLEI